MCIQCEIEDTIIDLHAKDYLVATLDGEHLSTGQMESMLGSPAFAQILLEVSERGRIAVEQGVFDIDPSAGL